MTQQEALKACFDRIEEWRTKDEGYNAYPSSDEYTKRTILREYCKPSETKTEGVFFYFPYVEYLEEDKTGFKDSEVVNRYLGYNTDYFSFDWLSYISQAYTTDKQH